MGLDKKKQKKKTQTKTSSKHFKEKANIENNCDEMCFYYLVLGSTGLSGATQHHLQGPGKDPQIRGLLLRKKKTQKSFNQLVLINKNEYRKIRWHLDYETIFNTE